MNDDQDDNQPENLEQKPNPSPSPQPQPTRRNRLQDFDVFAPSPHDFDL
jgi:hypothetical protein